MGPKDHKIQSSCIISTIQKMKFFERRQDRYFRANYEPQGIKQAHEKYNQRTTLHTALSIHSYLFSLNLETPRCFQIGCIN